MKKKIKKNLIILFVASLLILPVISLAVIPPTPGAKTIDGLLTSVLTIIWQVAIALATIMIIAAGIMFIMAAGSPDKVVQARQTLVFAVVGIVVAVVAFSLGTILQGIF